MKRFLLAMVGFISCITLSQPVKAAAYSQRSSALIYHPSSMRTVNDADVHFVRSSRSYTHMKPSSKTNWVRSVAGHKVAFKTRLLLPYPGKPNESWGNPQSIAIAKNQMMYIVYCPTMLRNRGRIVRYDLKRLEQLGAYKNPQSLRTVYWKHHGKYSKQQKNMQKAIKVGPLFDTGHGQTLAINPKDNHMYMWRDNRNSRGKQYSLRAYMRRINSQSLKPDRTIGFYLRAHGQAVYGGGTQAFDRFGNSYFWCKNGLEADIYKGRIASHTVKFRKTDQVIKRAPGTYVQSMGYNPKRGRLYLIADDSIVSFPAKQLNGHGSLNKHSFEWSKLKPKRELEGLTFDEGGHAYLLTNHNPEVLRSTSIY